VARSGFETLIRYAAGGGRDRTVVVEALDATGRVLGRSRAATVGTRY
jgi:hypothetical protein